MQKAQAAIDNANAKKNADQDAKLQVVGAPNAASHNKEYKAFIRAIENKKFPKDLNANKDQDRLGLFKLWLDNGRDWGSVRLQISRKLEQETKQTQKVGWVKVRKLEYPDEKKKVVVAQAKVEGRIKDDPLFPNDEEEKFILIEVESGFSKTNTKTDAINLQVEGEVTGDEVAALTSPEGILDAGGDGFLGITDAIHRALQSTPPPKSAKVPKQAKPKATAGASAQHVEADDMSTMLENLRKDILKEAGEARSLSVALQGDDMSVNLVDSFKRHSDFLYAAYSSINELIKQKQTDLADVAPLMETLDSAMAWYSTRSQAAKAWWRKLHPKKSADGKDKAEEDSPLKMQC